MTLTHHILYTRIQISCQLDTFPIAPLCDTHKHIIIINYVLKFSFTTLRIMSLNDSNKVLFCILILYKSLFLTIPSCFFVCIQYCNSIFKLRWIFEETLCLPYKRYVKKYMNLIPY